ncbi:MAG TPA: hypothetical protein PKD37_01255 [Oligoflexia bacterium]|nr:hypothetical protein [Oligoflexia bacterium]HMP26603.1 hypothetical protein [Oligoflexia bacterium]
MNYLLYGVWIFIPLFFYIVAFLGWLDSISNNKKKQYDNPGDYFRQGVFCTVAVIITFALDIFVLKVYYQQLTITEYIPTGMMRVFLLPIVLIILAVVVGPSKEIKLAAPKKK